MASVSQLTQGNLLPFRIYNDGDVINWYSLDGTGQNGQFVALETGYLLTTSGLYSQNPEAGFGNFTANSVGAGYTNTVSLRYQNSRKVRPTQSGDNVFNTLGVTLHTTANVDENLNPLVNLPYDRTLERGYVLSGFSVPVLTRGVVTLKAAQYNGTPYPGYVGCISSGGPAGEIDVVNPINLYLPTGGNPVPQTPGAVYTPWTVVGKFLSTSGVSFGGYAQFKVDL